MIDELPQAVDILRGSMSLFGPRADKPEHIDDLFGAIEDEELRDRWLEARSSQKPGIVSSYAIHSHAHNLEGASEDERFSDAEILAQNALQRATLDIRDFEHASLAYDMGLLKAASSMAVGNYAHYAQGLFVPDMQVGTSL
jgi:lipopolysaccharide/colanic/teichoic acid biosynthesis glycosyltransferase